MNKLIKLSDENRDAIKLTVLQSTVRVLKQVKDHDFNTVASDIIDCYESILKEELALVYEMLERAELEREAFKEQLIKHALK